MSFDWILDLFIPTLTIFVGMVLACIGIRGFILLKPVVFNGRWIFLFIALCFLPVILLQAEPLFDNRMVDIVVDFTLSFLILMALFWRKTRGYIIFGVPYLTLRKGLPAVLDLLKLPHTDSTPRIRFRHVESVIRLDSIDAEFHISTLLWLEISQVYIRPRKHKKLMVRILTGVSRHFYRIEIPGRWIKGIILFLLGFGAILAGIAMIQ